MSGTISNFIMSDLGGLLIGLPLFLLFCHKLAENCKQYEKDSHYENKMPFKGEDK